MIGNLNLCKEIIDVMKVMEFKESSILKIKNDIKFIDAYAKDNSSQKAMLTMIFYNIFMYGNTIVPSQIRVALNIATDITGWLDDIKLVILPFLKENEELFFN